MNQPDRTPARGGPSGPDGDWPRDFGRDGVSGLVSPDRAMRARDVSRPRPSDLAAADEVIDRLVSRANGRR